MLRWLAHSPVRIGCASMLGVVIWLAMLGSSEYVYSWIYSYLPNNPDYLMLFSRLSLPLMLLVGSAPLLGLWMLGYPVLQRGLPLIGIGILILYGALILWPAYDSGLAWFDADPKGASDYYDVPWEGYHVWYMRQGIQELNLLDRLTLSTLVGTMLASWYYLLPLGAITLALLSRTEPQLEYPRERRIIMYVGLLMTVVPVLTWTASHQFMRWFFD